MSNSLTALRALVATDLRLFIRDRRAVILNLVTPLVISGLFGIAFGGNGKAVQSAIPVAVVDLDRSAVSTRVVTGLDSETSIDVVAMGAEEAREAVRKGDTRAAIVLPPGFGEAAGRAFFNSGARPAVQLLHDPSQPAVAAMVEGMLTQRVFEAVSGEVFGASSGVAIIDDALAGLDSNTSLSDESRADLRELLTRSRRLNERSRQGAAGQQPATQAGLSMPFEVRTEGVTSGQRKYNGLAHATAGMGVQFVLFMGIEAGVALLLLRQRGLWLRLRAAPLSRRTLLTAKMLGYALTALLMLVVLYAGARLLYGVTIDGSFLGFLLVIITFSMTAAAFGLLLAAVGGSPASTRGLATFATLVMVLLGGGWVPSFMFPDWLQQAGNVLPTRWAITGLEGTTWRGFSLAETLPSVLALTGFTVVFLAIAAWRFRWQPRN